jgi:hypothetical protein
VAQDTDIQNMLDIVWTKVSKGQSLSYYKALRELRREL